MSELRGLQLRAKDFQELGARIVAVSVDGPELNREVVESLGLDFPVLADPKLEAIRAFGLVHEKGAPDGSDIARPAIYLIEDGRIRYRELTENWRVRARPDELLEIARDAFQAS